MSRRPISYQLRLSVEEDRKLKAYAESQGVYVAEILRDFIKSLPDLTAKKTQIQETTTPSATAKN